MDLLALLITGLILVGILIFHLYRKTWVGTMAGQKSGSQALLKRLSEEVAVLGSSIEIFSELSEEYFISITSNGFADLCKINEALKTTIDLCLRLGEANDTRKQEELLRYVQVQRGKGASPGFLFQMMNDDLIQNLDSWDERLAAILIKLTDGIRHSSSSFKSVGRYRSSKRHNTTQLLNDLVGLVRQSP